MKTKMRLRTIVKTTALILVLIAASITTASAITCTCDDVCVNTTGWWRSGETFNPSDRPIQDAVDNATEGDIICVMDGTYTENVDVNKQLTIQSEHNLGAKVQSASTDDHVFEVTADYVNISGFDVSGATSSSVATFYGAVGIRLNSADYCDISKNYAHENSHGIYLYDSHNNMLRDNTASYNYGEEDYFGRGIYLYESSSNTLTGNTASDNDLGIHLMFSGSNTLTGNIASNHNVCGIGLSFLSDNTLTSNTVSNSGNGIVLWYTSDNTLTSNTASNNQNGIYMWNASSNKFTGNTANSNDYHGIGMENSSSNTFESNTANSNKNSGIVQDSSNHNLFTSNTASYNEGGIGIWLRDSSSSNTLTGNTANSNNYYGIRLDSSSNDNIITGNTANSNKINGIRLIYSSNNNLIYNNYFDNTNNAYDDGTNYWNIAKEEGTNIIGGSYLGGNYWSDYAGWDCDCDRDGLGDTEVPYNSDGKIQNDGDYLPLAESDTIPPIITVDTPTPYELYSVSVTLDFSASDDQCGVNTLEGHLTNTAGVSQIVNSGDTVTEPGVYTLTAVDYACNPSESDVCFVVYDPEGGFATGGGWFYPDEESTLPGGRANFGFVAKYKKGSSTGNLEFQYKDADINLKSTSVDWLVISEVSAQFQGTGTINGNGLYTFRVRAKDNGEPGVGVDHFDIMIWDGTDTEGDPIHKAKNVLAGGNIVVHKK